MSLPIGATISKDGAECYDISYPRPPGSMPTGAKMSLTTQQAMERGATAADIAAADQKYKTNMHQFAQELISKGMSIIPSSRDYAGGPTVDAKGRTVCIIPDNMFADLAAEMRMLGSHVAPGPSPRPGPVQAPAQQLTPAELQKMARNIAARRIAERFPPHQKRLDARADWLGRVSPKRQERWLKRHPHSPFSQFSTPATAMTSASPVQGMSGLGSLASDLDRRTKLVASIQSFYSEVGHAIDGLSRGNFYYDKAKVYLDTMQKMIDTLGDNQYAIDLQAGGAAAKQVQSMMNSYDRLLVLAKEKWAADLQDPTGATSDAIDQKIRNAATAKTIAAAENVKFWEGVTDINNPFSPVGILDTIKKYAIWGLVIGGVVLAAPVLFPAIGKLIGHARQPSAPAPVKANRRR